MKIISHLFILLLFSSVISNAQTTLNSSGGNDSSLNGSVSYSIGQLVYNSSGNLNGSVLNGPQIAYEIIILLELQEFKEDKIVLKTYPNPTSDILILEIDNLKKNKLDFKLFDTNGKLKHENKINSNLTTINMETYQNACYILNVFSGSSVVKSFKILKNK